MNINSQKFGIISIATRNYIEYWKEMVLTFDSHLEIEGKVVFRVFTDQPEKALTTSNCLNHCQVRVHVS